jgi:uncharacterized protein YraI
MTEGKELMMKRSLARFVSIMGVVVLAPGASIGMSSASATSRVRIVSVTGPKADYIHFSRSENVWRYSACYHTKNSGQAYLQYKEGNYWQSVDAKKTFTYNTEICSKHYPHWLQISLHENYRGTFSYRIGFPTEYFGAKFEYFTVTAR